MNTDDTDYDALFAKVAAASLPDVNAYIGKGRPGAGLCVDRSRPAAIDAVRFGGGPAVCDCEHVPQRRRCWRGRGAWRRAVSGGWWGK